MGCKLNKKGTLSPHLKFPLIVHIKRYMSMPPKMAAARNPMLAFSRSMSMVFKYGFYGILGLTCVE